MAQVEPKTRKSFGELLQSLERPHLFAVLLIVVSISQFVASSVPNRPVDPSIDLFATLMRIPEGQTVLIQSDWTNSTRAESAGEFEALLRILMRRNIKFAIYGLDPQSPQVARDEIARINDERRAAKQREYRRWDDWIDLRYFPNAEGTGQAFAADFVGAVKARKELDPSGVDRPAIESPVLKNIKSIKDFPLVVIVTASATMTIMIERYYGRVPIAGMVTGVMGPETEIYYRSGQLMGLASGLKGVYDLEMLMEHGLNVEGPDGKKVIESSKVRDSIPGFPGQINFSKGMRYYPPLHFALYLLILSIIAGNVGMFLTRKRRAQ